MKGRIKKGKLVRKQVKLEAREAPEYAVFNGYDPTISVNNDYADWVLVAQNGPPEQPYPLFDETIGDFNDQPLDFGESQMWSNPFLTCWRMAIKNPTSDMLDSATGTEIVANDTAPLLNDVTDEEGVKCSRAGGVDPMMAQQILGGGGVTIG